MIEGEADDIAGMLTARQVEPFAQMGAGGVVAAVPLQLPAVKGQTLRQEAGIAGLARETHGLRRVTHRLDDRPVDAASCLAAQRMTAGLACRVADLGCDGE